MVVLSLDDEKTALRIMREVLSKIIPDAEVHCFDEASEAIEFVKNNSCDVAFLDIEMREMNGIQVAKIMKQYKPLLNVIFATGYDEYTSDALGLHCSGYVMKPVTVDKVRRELEDLRHPLSQSIVSENSGLFCKAFGNFEVFYDGKPVKFTYSKTKELLAYLIDRQGAMCTNGEIMGALWEDVDEGASVSYFKNIRAELTKFFTDIDKSDALVRFRGSIGISKEDIRCDYFDWLSGKTSAINSYQGEYMTQYSWSEFTNGSLEYKKNGGF